MVQVKNYNINDILKLQIRTDNRSLLKGLNFSLSYFEISDELNDPDILLNIGKFAPSNDDCYLVDHKYYIKEDYFYCKDSDGKARWEVEIAGFENSPTIINFDGRVGGMYRCIAPDLLAQDTALLPIIELFLGKKGSFLAHGAGVVKESGAIIFLGRSGSLKSTIVMDAVRNGHKILGDDRLILNTRNNMAYNFPILSQIFEYTVENFNDEYISIFGKILLSNALLKERSSTSDIWQSGPSSIESICLLKRENAGNCEIEISPISKNIAIRKIIANNKAEIYGSSIPSINKRNFMAYMNAYSFVFPDTRIARYWNDLGRGLEKFLRNIPIYEIKLPKDGDPNMFDEICGLIQDV